MRGVELPTLEHFYHAMKFDSPEAQDEIRNQPTAVAAQCLGTTRDPLRPVRAKWEEEKDAVMLEGLKAKFMQKEDLRCRDALLATGAAKLMFTYDAEEYWATGAKGLGGNRLGIMLEDVREQLRLLLDGRPCDTDLVFDIRGVPTNAMFNMSSPRSAKDPSRPAEPGDTPMCRYKLVELSPDVRSPFMARGELWPSVTHLVSAMRVEMACTVGRRPAFLSIGPEAAAVRTQATAAGAREAAAESVRQDLPGWVQTRARYTLEALRAKFVQNAEARETLLRTGRRQLVFDDDDAQWGTGGDGDGLNQMGQLLEVVREEVAPLAATLDALCVSGIFEEANDPSVKPRSAFERRVRIPPGRLRRCWEDDEGDGERYASMRAALATLPEKPSADATAVLLPFLLAQQPSLVHDPHLCRVLQRVLPEQHAYGREGDGTMARTLALDRAVARQGAAVALRQRGEWRCLDKAGWEGLPGVEGAVDLGRPGLLQLACLLDCPAYVELLCGAMSHPVLTHRGAVGAHAAPAVQFSAWHCAAYSSSIDCISALIQHCRDAGQCGINSPDHTGATPLHIACQFVHIVAVQRLLEAGADPCVRDHAHLDAHDVALFLEARHQRRRDRLRAADLYLAAQNETESRRNTPQPEMLVRRGTGGAKIYGGAASGSAGITKTTSMRVDRGVRLDVLKSEHSFGAATGGLRAEKAAPVKSVSAQLRRLSQSPPTSGLHEGTGGFEPPPGGAESPRGEGGALKVFQSLAMKVRTRAVAARSVHRLKRAVTRKRGVPTSNALKEMTRRLHQDHRVAAKLTRSAWLCTFRESFMYLFYIICLTQLATLVCQRSGNNFAAGSIRGMLSGAEYPAAHAIFGESYNWRNSFYGTEAVNDMSSWLRYPLTASALSAYPHGYYMSSDQGPLGKWRLVGTVRVVQLRADPRPCPDTPYCEILRKEDTLVSRAQAHVCWTEQVGEDDQLHTAHNIGENSVSYRWLSPMTGYVYTINPDNHVDLTPGDEYATVANNLTTDDGSPGSWFDAGTRLVGVYTVFYDKSIDTFAIARTYFETLAHGRVYPTMHISAFHLMRPFTETSAGIVFLWLIFLAGMSLYGISEAVDTVLDMHRVAITTYEKNAASLTVRRESGAASSRWRVCMTSLPEVIWQRLIVAVKVAFAAICAAVVRLGTDWNLFDMAMVALQAAAIAKYVTFYKYSQRVWSNEDLLNATSPTFHGDFVTLSICDETLRRLSGAIMLVGWARVAKYFELLPHMGPIVVSIIATVTNKDLIAFFLLYAVWILAFYFCIRSAIGVEHDDMTWALPAAFYTFRLTLGDWDFDSMSKDDVIYGSVVFLSAALFVNIIFLNIFIAVVAEAYADARRAFSILVWRRNAAQRYLFHTLLPAGYMARGLDWAKRTCGDSTISALTHSDAAGAEWEMMSDAALHQFTALGLTGDDQDADEVSRQRFDDLQNAVQGLGSNVQTKFAELGEAVKKASALQDTRIGHVTQQVGLLNEMLSSTYDFAALGRGVSETYSPRDRLGVSGFSPAVASPGGRVYSPHVSPSPHRASSPACAAGGARAPVGGNGAAVRNASVGGARGRDAARTPPHPHDAPAPVLDATLPPPAASYPAHGSRRVSLRAAGDHARQASFFSSHSHPERPRVEEQEEERRRSMRRKRSIALGDMAEQAESQRWQSHAAPAFRESGAFGSE